MKTYQYFGISSPLGLLNHWNKCLISTALRNEYTYYKTKIIIFFSYNLEDTNVNDSNFDKLDRSVVPDVILVKKHYGDRSFRKRQRIWKLKRLAEGDTAFDPDAKYVKIYLLIICSLYLRLTIVLSIVYDQKNKSTRLFFWFFKYLI